jgi:hypothetical protein
VQTSDSNGSARHELRINDTSKRRVSEDGYVVELTALAHYPFVSRPIAASDYRATVVVSYMP